MGDTAGSGEAVLGADENQQSNLGRQREASRDPVAARYDPAVARQNGDRKRYAGYQKVRGRPADIGSQ